MNLKFRPSYIPFFSFFFFFLTNLSAQQLPIIWGRLKESEKKLIQCEYSKDAGAVILAEYGEVAFNYGSEAYITIHRRIKILNESGLNQANVKIPYYTVNELVLS